MRRFFAVCSIVAALMVGVWAVSAAQSKGTSFAGAWTLDKSKSELGRMADFIQSMTWTITQDDKQLTRETKVEQNPNAQAAGGGGGGGGRGGGRGMGMGGGGPLTVKFDGSETTTESQRGKSTTKAKWADGGKGLEITTTANFSGPNGDITSTTVEHWELADGGKTLKVHRKTESQRGPQESNWTFTKQ